MAAIRQTASKAASQAALAGSAAKASLRFGAIDLNEEKNADLVIARHLWQDHRLLPPLSLNRDRWARLLKAFMTYTCFIIPMRIAFGSTRDAPLDNNGLKIFEIIIDVCFWIDILLNFRTATYSDTYELVFEPSLIAKGYIASGWFWLDFLGGLPLDYLLIGANTPSERTAHAVLQLNRMLRVARLWKPPPNLIAKLDRRSMASAKWMRIFLDFRALFYFAHIVGCVWWQVRPPLRPTTLRPHL